MLTVPAVGWWILGVGVVVVAVLTFVPVNRAVRRSSAPEYSMAASWAFVQALIAPIVAFTGEDALTLAESLRAAVAREPLRGLPITMSFGVAGSGGGPFDPAAVLAAADVALYDAKAQGRDRVVTAGPPAPASLAG